jgi:hypothetical protein
MTSSRGGDFFSIFQKVPLTMLLETFSYSEMMNFHHKIIIIIIINNNNLVNSFYLFKHYLLDFFIIISYLLITIKILEYLD